MNVSRQQSTPENGRQFRLVKFFALASFVVLVIFSFPFSVVISQQAKHLLMRSHENYARLLGTNLNYQVLQKFVWPVMRRYGGVALRSEAQTRRMDTVVRNTIHGFKIDVVNIYDINKGVVAYSTNPALLGKKVQPNLGYQKAVGGKVFSGLISEGDDLLGLGIERLGGEKKLRTYIPFIGMDPLTGKLFVGGVFELIQDLTDEYGVILRLQYLIFGLSILIMALIFLALLMIVRKAEAMIEQHTREQRELEAQLNQAERLAALGQMCAGVSHEIRNPLGIIRSTAELLGSMPNAEQRQKNLSKVIIEESSRLNDIVTEFLDFARPQQPNLQDCDLEEILHKNLAFLAPELSKENIRLEHNLDHQPMKLRADPQMLYRAFLNLFVNAIQAMPRGGTLRVEVGEQNGHYVVRIQDTGSGIDRENLKRIFDPFFSTKNKGSGLGLSIVRNIIKAHQGAIAIDSDPGEGTRVVLRLPRS